MDPQQDREILVLLSVHCVICSRSFGTLGLSKLTMKVDSMLPFWNSWSNKQRNVGPLP